MKIDILSMIWGIILTIGVAYLLPDKYKYVFNSKFKPKAKREGTNNIKFSEKELRKQMKLRDKEERKQLRKNKKGLLKRILTKKNK